MKNAKRDSRNSWHSPVCLKQYFIINIPVPRLKIKSYIFMTRKSCVHTNDEQNKVNFWIIISFSPQIIYWLQQYETDEWNGRV